MTPDEAMENMGKGVVYRPGHDAAEDGVITGVSGNYVFVRYAGDTGSKATDSRMLELLAPDPVPVDGCACGVTTEHGPHEEEIPDVGGHAPPVDVHPSAVPGSEES